MATHSSILAWRIPWTEEPGGLQSIGSQRVRHERVTKHSTLGCLPGQIWDLKVVHPPLTAPGLASRELGTGKHKSRRGKAEMA